MRAVDLIAKKRDGHSLAEAELHWLINSFTAGQVTDYQMSAFAMAVYLNGMTAKETAALTLAMRDSGKRASFGGRPARRVDKHSTGGVGDKVSICLAPMVAACGVAVPMISGRGLGHTGGTLDKLEAIDGFQVDQPLGRFQQLVRRHGLALIGQTADLAPADRKLYALRDVTATVESIPLITASILSKKLAEDLSALVMDVKVGRGAFMKNLTDARPRARSIAREGRQAGTPVSALITRMDQPLGRTVGNALETREAMEVLHGHGTADLLECTMALGAEMLRAVGAAKTLPAARRQLDEAIHSGAAARTMADIVRAQGGDPRVVDEPDRLPRAPVITRLKARQAGYVLDLDAMAVARIALDLGAGRERADQQIDNRVGLVLEAKPGEPVKLGQTLAEVHAATKKDGRRAISALAPIYKLGKRRPKLPPLVVETVRR